MTHHTDPVHYHLRSDFTDTNGLVPMPEQQASGWYFWDETWADRHGPFLTEAECRSMFEAYCREHLDGIPGVSPQPNTSEGR